MPVPEEEVCRLNIDVDIRRPDVDKPSARRAGIAAGGTFWRQERRKKNGPFSLA